MQLRLLDQRDSTAKVNLEDFVPLVHLNMVSNFFFSLQLNCAVAVTSEISGEATVSLSLSWLNRNCSQILITMYSVMQP